MTKFLVGIIVAAAVLVAPASADNYGCTNQAQCRKMERIIYAKFGNGWQGRTAVCIARAESGLNPRAANWGDANGGSHGLFQINGIHRWAYGKGKTSIYNPWHNTNVAYRLSRGGSSWGAWTTAYKC